MTDFKEMANSIQADVKYDFASHAKLRIVTPSTIVDKFNYKGATGALEVQMAHFGRYQTGTSITAPLFYPPVAEDGCGDMTPTDEMKETYNMEWKGFVIVKDGNCTFEEKARNVQAMGAQALLISEDLDSQLEMRDTHDSWSKYDGSGTSIHIPTFLVQQPHGDDLIELVKGKTGFEDGE